MTFHTGAEVGAPLPVTTGQIGQYDTLYQLQRDSGASGTVRTRGDEYANDGAGVTYVDVGALPHLVRLLHRYGAGRLGLPAHHLRGKLEHRCGLPSTSVRTTQPRSCGKPATWLPGPRPTVFYGWAPTATPS